MIHRATLCGESLTVAVAPIRAGLAKRDQGFLDRLLAQFAELPYATESSCCVGIFGKANAMACSSLFAFQQKFNNVAKAMNIGLRLTSGGASPSPAGKRYFRFELLGVEQGLAGVSTNEIDQDQLHWCSDSIGSSTQKKKSRGKQRIIRFFVSYAHKDGKTPMELLDLLQTQFRSSQRYRFQAWTDQRIDLGSDWHNQIRAALLKADVGLLMISPAFLGSEYITKNELLQYVHPIDSKSTRPVIPIGLKPISFERQDLKGLEKRQIFVKAGRSYFDFSSLRDKEAFAHELFLRIEYTLDDWFGLK